MSDTHSASSGDAGWQPRRSPLLDQPPRRGDISNVSRFRFWLAAFLVTITPGTLLLWGHLHLSGYTYNNDGSRDLGHLAKAIPSDLVLASLVGLAVLGLGLLTVRLARHEGVLTAPRLLLSAGATGVALGLLASGALTLIPDNRASAGRLLSVFLAVTATAAITSVLLCLEFMVVSGTPFRALTVSEARPAALIDRAVLLAALVATVTATAWVGSLWVFSLNHPCNCG